MKEPTAGWVMPAKGHSVFANEPSADSLDLGDRPSKRRLSRLVGPCVYFIRTQDGLIKIGHTGNLGKRHNAYGPGWDHLLAVVPGDRELEKAQHRRFAAHLARGREWFHPAPDLIDYINDIRSRLGVPPVE